ncbi:MAG: hypothetical protein ACERKV_10515 [Clostridiaceae bacterium]
METRVYMTFSKLIQITTVSFLTGLVLGLAISGFIYIKFRDK